MKKFWTAFIVVLIISLVGCKKDPIFYTLNSSSTVGGTISPLGVTSVEEGKSIVFSIKPDNHYSIASITVDGVKVPVASTIEIKNVTSDKEIKVEFASKVTITAIASPGGKISPSNIEVDAGSDVSFTLIPDFGFKNPSTISVNGSDIALMSDSYNISKIASDYTIKATFEKNLSWYFVQTKFVLDSTLIKEENGSWSRYKLWGVKGEIQHIYSFLPDGSYTVYDDVLKKIIGSGPTYLWSIDEAKSPAILNLGGELTELEEVSFTQIRSAKYDVANWDPKIATKGSVKIIFTPYNN